MSEILKFENVSVYYALKHKGETCAVDNFSYSFIKGKKYAIVGYSGSGKTSLVRTITGGLVFDGQIYLEGKPIEEVPIQDRKITFVNQNINLFPHLTIYDNIVFPLRNSKVDHDYADEKVKEIAKRLNLLYLLTRKPKMVSIGQAARAVIAKALVKKNDLMIFDEALANLDAISGKKTLKIINEIATENGSTVLFITHDINEALAIADYILVMHEGKLVGDYTPQAFLCTDNEIVNTLKDGLKHEEEN